MSDAVNNESFAFSRDIIILHIGGRGAEEKSDWRSGQGESVRSWVPLMHLKSYFFFSSAVEIHDSMIL